VESVRKKEKRKERGKARKKWREEEEERVGSALKFSL
jgi:hypothetical protein